MSSWKQVKGWEGIYEVSNDAVIRRVKDGYVVTQWSNQLGYRLAKLSGPRKDVKVHRVVAEAFIENPYNKKCVNHINNNTSDNRVTNLEWCTQLENLEHMRKQGRGRSYGSIKGQRSLNAKLTDDQVRAIRVDRTSGMSFEKIAEKHSSNKKSVMKCCRRETYAYVQ